MVNRAVVVVALLGALSTAAAQEETCAAFGKRYVVRKWCCYVVSEVQAVFVI